MKHHSVAHHKALAAKAKKAGKMAAYQKHLAEAKEAAKKS